MSGSMDDGTDSQNGDRWVSLDPAMTELVCAAGFGSNLVGRSHLCDFPETVSSLPSVTGFRGSSAASGREIDAFVRDASLSGASVIEIDFDAIHSLAPTALLVQETCPVCGPAIDDLAGEFPGVSIVRYAPTNLASVWDGMLGAFSDLGIAEPGRTLVKALKTRIVDVIQKACVLRPRPAVLGLEWLDPAMGVGHWIPDLIQLAGGEERIARSGQRSEVLLWDRIREADPDVLVVVPCGFDLDRAMSEARTVLAGDGWRRLRAVRKGRVFVMDGSGFVTRPGSRLPDALEAFSEMLHPGVFSFGHEGTIWRRI